MFLPDILKLTNFPSGEEKTFLKRFQLCERDGFLL